MQDGIVSPIEARAIRLVEERIGGMRKGTQDLARDHSIRVGQRLKRHGYPEDVVIAGILHDIVEDGKTSLEELTADGFSDRTVRLVDLASHDASIPDKRQRWAQMIERLRVSGDPAAWALKICDLIDNLNGCRTMPDESSRRFFVETKAPMFLRLAYPVLGATTLYRELVDTFSDDAQERFSRLLERRDEL